MIATWEYKFEVSTKISMYVLVCLYLIYAYLPFFWGKNKEVGSYAPQKEWIQTKIPLDVLQAASK